MLREPHGPPKGEDRMPNHPCEICSGRGLLQAGNGVRYCWCTIGQAKKREWYAHPANWREECEREVPTYPDAQRAAENRAETGLGSSDRPPLEVTYPIAYRTRQKPRNALLPGI